ncbi:SNF2 family N-terminal domain-containing protein [Xylogone sp. PMI_703]|nr:SNF2 family N-terminal domain-containing protein [Xylogone sp. PMI_703]
MEQNIPSSSQGSLSIAELMNEIAFQKVLLSSIDDSVEDREDAEAEVRAEIKALERQLRALRQGASTRDFTPSQSTPLNGSDVSSNMSSRSDSRSLNSSPAKGAFPSMASTPDPQEFDDSLIETPKAVLPTRKRAYSGHSGGNLGPQVNKSRRTSPSPYADPGSTASSTGRVWQERGTSLEPSSDNEFEDFDKEFFKRQQQEEQRIRREKLDAEFARKIQNEESDPAPRDPPPSQHQGPSAFDRINGVRPPPVRAPILPPPAPSFMSLRAPPGAYPSDEEDEEDESDDYGDSDLEIIPSSAFHGNSKNKDPFASSRVYQTSNYPLNSVHGRLQSAANGPGLQQPGHMPNPYGMMGNYAGGYPNASGSGSSSSGYGPHNAYYGSTQHSMSMANGLSKIIDYTSSALYDREHGYLYDDRYAEQVDYIVNDPRKTTEEITALLENIRPDSELPAENREGTPDGLKYPLYEHQKLALTWLKSMEEGTNKGGILADDMGLGKTISSLALILSRPSTDRGRKTTLIVGPVALVRQWEREIRTKTKASHKLSTHMVHGQARKLTWDELRNFDIVLTTYGTLGAEYSRMKVYLEKQKERGNNQIDETPMKKLFPLLGPKSLFYRVILDEAQYIKNKTTKAALAACQLKSLTRFCLTGTPMMNNVGELYSLIHFLRIRPYNEWSRFSADFGKLTKGGSKDREMKNAMLKLQAVLKAILLRRTKKSLIDGKPIITLPPKTEEIKHVVFSDDEQAYYRALETQTQLQFNKYMRAGTVGKNYSNILVLLLRLRQCCCHPHLITDLDEAPTEISKTDMIKLAESLAPEVVGRLLAAEAFECPVCYDGVPNPRIVIPCGHDTCSECLSKLMDQAVQQGVANGNEGAPVSKCPTCRGKIEMDKVIDYKSFKKVHVPNASDDASASETDSSSDDSSDEDDSDDADGDDDDADNYGNLKGFIVPDDIESSDASDGENDSGSGKAPETIEPTEEETSKKKKDKQKQKKKVKKVKAKGKGKEKQGRGKKKHLSIAMMKKNSNTAEGRRRYMRYLRKNWQPSAKTNKCIELLKQFHDEGKKTIVFSQFVSLLDLLQIPIEKEGWAFERYDGGMNAEARNAAIVRFTDKPDCKIMLVSLKAGNAGLNLVAASRVIILDPFWNPFVEMQAVDRAYRIGQQNPVEVHRILIEATVEDRIIELQEKKRKLVDAALDEKAHKSLGRLDVRQLAFLFGVDGNRATT